jgi:hypothetical protein
MDAVDKGDTVMTGPEVVTLREHLEALRAADDRRYAEVNVEKEKALKIKETADLAALQLAREIQTYKDEKANELREQIGSERGLYATKDDVANMSREIYAQMKPALDYVAHRQGATEHSDKSTRNLVAYVGVSLALLNIVAILIVLI